MTTDHAGQSHERRVQSARPPHLQALQRVIERRFAADLARKHPGTVWTIVDSPPPIPRQRNRRAGTGGRST